MPTDEQVRELAFLSQGLSPAWEIQGTYADASGAPGPSDGVLLNDNVVAMYLLRLRTDPRYQAGTVTINTVAAGNYTATVNGTDFTYAATGAEAVGDIAISLAALIDAGAEPVGASATGAAVNILGEDADAFTLVTAAGDMTSLREADTVTYNIWVKANGTWGTAATGLTTSFSGNSDPNAIKRVSPAGLDAIFIEIVTTDGVVVVESAPCEVS